MSDKTLNPAEAYCKKLRMQFPTAYLSDLAVVLRMLETSSYEYEWVGGGLIDKAPEFGPNRLTEEGWRSFENLNNGRAPTKWTAPHRDSVLFVIPDDAGEHWLEFIDSQLSYVTEWDRIKIHAWIDAYYELRDSDVQYKMSQIRDAQENFNLVQDAANVIRERIRFIQDARYKKLYPPHEEIRKGSVVRSKAGVLYATVMEIDKVVGEYHVPMARLDPPLPHPLHKEPKAWWVLSLLVLKDEPCLADLA